MQNIIKQKKLQNTINEYKVKLIKGKARTLGTTKEKSYFSHSIEQLER